MSVYSTLFLNVNVAAGGSASYSVPTGKIAVVRCISMMPTGAGLTGANLQASGVALIWAVTTGTLNITQHWDGRQVINSGGSIVARNTGAGADWLVSGYLLDNS